MARQIIGFTGRMGSGKSTAAEILERDGWSRTRFAEPLKQMMRCIGLTHAHIEGDLKEVPCELLGGHTPRYAMQTIGTEWGRDIISKSLWIDVWKQHVQDIATSVTVEDVRFPNEVLAVRQVGGILVRVLRPGKSHAAIKHSSEKMDDLPVDITIVNDGTLSEFIETVRALRDLCYTPEGQPYLAAA